MPLSRRGGRLTCLLLRQEKVSKEKATLLSASLRCATGNLRCSAQPGSSSNSLRSNNRSPCSVWTSAPRRIQKGLEVRNSETIEPASRAQWRYFFNRCSRTYSLGYRPKCRRNCVQQFKLHHHSRHPDQGTNCIGFHRSFITVQICTTFSRSPIHTRFPEEFDAKIKLQCPD